MEYQQILNPQQTTTKEVSFEDLENTIKRHLLITDDGIIRVLVACVLANLCLADPVWLLIVAPSGGAKTELLRGLNGLDFIYPISDLTPQTFLSGMKYTNGSLLLRLESGTIITMKDFTTVLAMHPDKRGAILSQLREIYDGDFRKEFGTGESKSWQGKIGFIGGVTSVIDQHQMVYQTLGERFIQYRPTQPDPIKLAERAMGNNGIEVEMREEIQQAFKDYIEGVEIPNKQPVLPDVYKSCIVHLAVLCANARSGVIREGRGSREIELVPEQEQPTRLVKQYSNLFNSLALISGKHTDEDYALLYKIGMDSLPTLRRRIIEHLAKAEVPCTVKDIAEAVHYPANTTSRQLEELMYLDLIKRNDKRQPYGYELLERTKDILNKAQMPIKQSMEDNETLPDKSEGQLSDE